MNTPSLARCPHFMEFADLLRLLWRWKVIVVAIFAVVMGAAVFALNVVSPTYEASSTLLVRPVGGSDYVLFSAVDSVIPVYTDAALANATRAEAEAAVGRTIDGVSVETDEGTPIIDIQVRSTDPITARENADALTEALLARAERREVGLDSLELVVVDPATTPTDPVFPRTDLTLLFAGALGLLLGGAAALLAGKLSSRVDSVEAIEDVLGLPCYAEIPDEPDAPGLMFTDAAAGDEPIRLFREALRDLRTNLRLSEGSFRSILLTSPEGHHGKTTVAVGLAITLARAGYRTLLVDADLRGDGASAAGAFGVAAGLAEALEGAPIHEVVTGSPVRDLDVVSRGGSIGEPGDALRGFPSLLQQSQVDYDVVVVDTTPLTPFNDARVLATFVDTTLLVVAADSADRKLLEAATRRLELISLRPTAFVLNKAKRRRVDAPAPTRTASQLPSRPRNHASA